MKARGHSGDMLSLSAIRKLGGSVKYSICFCDRYLCAKTEKEKQGMCLMDKKDERNYFKKIVLVCKEGLEMDLVK